MKKKKEGFLVYPDRCLGEPQDADSVPAAGQAGAQVREACSSGRAKKPRARPSKKAAPIACERGGEATDEARA